MTAGELARNMPRVQDWSRQRMRKALGAGWKLWGVVVMGVYQLPFVMMMRLPALSLPAEYSAHRSNVNGLCRLVVERVVMPPVEFVGRAGQRHRHDQLFQAIAHHVFAGAGAAAGNRTALRPPRELAMPPRP